MRWSLVPLLLIVLLFVGDQGPISQTADAPNVVIDAPVKARVGWLIRFDASASNASSLQWEIVPKTEDFEVVENGTRAFLAHGEPAEFLVIVAGALGDKVALKTHKVVIQGESSSGLVAKIKSWLPAGYSKDEAKQIAHSFRVVASLPGMTAANAVESTATANNAALGEQLEAWKPFLDQLITWIHSKHLTSKDQYEKLWIEIADAIDRAVE